VSKGGTSQSSDKITIDKLSRIAEMRKIKIYHIVSINIEPIIPKSFSSPKHMSANT
jgi:hypothetical protein